MRIVRAAAALAAMAGLLFVVGPHRADAQEARNIREFCGVYQGVCNRTCPAGAGRCQAECQRRNATCMATQCFPFNSPGPRCFTDATARRLTDIKLAPDPERERRRRAGQ